MMIYEFHPLAARELDEAVDYYESLVSGKGLELAQQIKIAINRICEFPESAPICTRRSTLFVNPAIYSLAFHALLSHQV